MICFFIFFSDLSRLIKQSYWRGNNKVHTCSLPCPHQPPKVSTPSISWALTIILTVRKLVDNSTTCFSLSLLSRSSNHQIGHDWVMHLSQFPTFTTESLDLNNPWSLMTHLILSHIVQLHIPLSNRSSSFYLAQTSPFLSTLEQITYLKQIGQGKYFFKALILF